MKSKHPHHLYLLFSIYFLLLFNGCIGEIARNPIDDDTPPILLSHTPTNDAINQPRNLRIELTFDDIMVLQSCNSNNFFLTEEATGNRVSISNYTIANSNHTLRLYMRQLLKTNTSYRVTLSGGPNNISQLPYTGKSWRFTTGTHLTNYHPIITITEPTNLRFCNSSFQASGNCDTVHYLYYSINTLSDWKEIIISNNNSWQTPLFDVTKVPFVEGTNKIYIRAKRIIEECELAITNRIDFVVDTTPPTVTITAPLTGSVLSNIIGAQGTASDNIALEKIEYTYTTPNFYTMPWLPAIINKQKWQISFNSRHASDCSSTIYIQAIDKAGNISDLSSANYHISNWQHVPFPHSPTYGPESWDIALSSTGNNHKLYYAGTLYNCNGTPLANSGPTGEQVKLAQDSNEDIHIVTWTTNSNSQQLSYARHPSRGGNFLDQHNQITKCDGTFTLFTHNTTPYIFYTRRTTSNELPSGTTDTMFWEGCLYTRTITSGWSEQRLAIPGTPWNIPITISLAEKNNTLYIALIKADKAFPNTTGGFLYIFQGSLLPTPTIQQVHEERVELNPIRSYNQTIVTFNSNTPTIIFVNNLQANHMSKSKILRFNGNIWTVNQYGANNTTSISTSLANNKQFYSYLANILGNCFQIYSTEKNHTPYGALHFGSTAYISPHTRLLATPTGLRLAIQVDGQIRVYSTAYPPTP